MKEQTVFICRYIENCMAKDLCSRKVSSKENGDEFKEKDIAFIKLCGIKPPCKFGTDYRTVYYIPAFLQVRLKDE